MMDEIRWYILGPCTRWLKEILVFFSQELAEIFGPGGLHIVNNTTADL